MMSWSARTHEALVAWLEATLSADIVEAVIPLDDPLRTWWIEDDLGGLVAVLIGGEDHLTLLALVQRARLVQPPPPELDERLAAELTQLSKAARLAPGAGDEDAFLCYAHEDTVRVTALQRLLAVDGIRLFRDVEQIRPGESITTRLHKALSGARKAVVVASKHSERSAWVKRERALLLSRHDALVFPVLIDDIPLPDEIADLFTIDLRGYGGTLDDGWARPRLTPLVARLRERE